MYTTALYLVAASVFLYLYTQLRRTFFLLWTLGWVCHVVYSLCLQLSTPSGETAAASTPFGIAADLSLLTGLLLMVAGACHFGNRKIPVAMISLTFLLGVGARLGAGYTEHSPQEIYIGTRVFLCLVTAWLGLVFFRTAEARQIFGLNLLFIVCLGWACFSVYGSLELSREHVMRIAGSDLAKTVELIWTGLTASMMIVVALEDTRHLLANSEARFRQFFECASDPIFLVDPEDGHFVDVNPKAQTLLGYDRAEMLGMGVVDLAAPPGQGTSPAGLLSKLRPQAFGPDVVQTHHRHKDGRLIPVSVTRNTVQLDAKEYLLLHARDISDLRAQEMLLASRISQLQAVQRISQILTRSLSVEELSSLLYERIQGFMPVDYFTIEVVQDERSLMRNLCTMQLVGGVMTRVPSSSAGGGIPDKDVKHLLEEREARLVTQQPAPVELADSYPGCCQSLLLLPMVAGDEPVGLMVIGACAPDAYDGSVLDLMQHIVSIAGIALRNAQLYERQHEQATRQQFVAELGPTLITTLDPLEIVGFVASRLKTHLDLSEVEVWLGSENLTQGALYRAFPPGRPASINLGQPGSTPPAYDIVTAAFSSGLTVVENDCRNSRLIPEAWLQERPLRSCLALPILVGERPVGVMRLDDGRRAERFRARDTEFVKLVAQITAASLEAARLFQASRMSEKRYSQLVEASRVGIAIVRDRKFEFANPFLIEMLELADHPVTEMQVLELVTEENSAAWRRAVELSEDGADQRVETWMHKPNGHRIYVEVLLAPIDYGGGRAVQLLMNDITERKVAQSQRQNDLRIRSIGTLTAGIGQDFQAIFSAILGQLAYLKLQAGPTDGGEASLMAIEAAVYRALDFTRQLMAFAETSTGGIQPIDINELLLAAARLHEGIAPERPRMKFDLTQKLPRVRGNEEQLRQAFLNLLLALSDRAGDGNVIMVRTTVEELDDARAGELGDIEGGVYVSAMFSDRRGVIDATVARELIQPSTVVSGRGSLGMSMLVSTVRSHQGALDIRRGGTATMLALLLPAESVPMPRSEAAARVEAEESNPKPLSYR